ncbi:hypothetical protein [Kitasatospora xanthocidica]|uniref:hypothetical protein n=1 Tax=Kitasatospora xanthocidica TaxID=83382 RepID=UPI0015F31D94|nr:hypothetical protein [Kitasatospora xanthocidica]
MRVFIATTYQDDGQAVTPVSIALLREDGASYYAIDASIGRAGLDPTQTVGPGLAHLPWFDGRLDRRHPAVRYRDRLACELGWFLKDTPSPELWSWRGDTDHLVLGRMCHRLGALPLGVPDWVGSLRQEAHRLALPLSDLPRWPHPKDHPMETARHFQRIARCLDAAAAADPRDLDTAHRAGAR